MLHLPRYSIASKLAENSLVVVYRGRRDADGAVVNVKCLKNDHPTESDLSRLRNEYAILSSLDVPGVPKAIGLERVGNSLVLITTDTGGVSLDVPMRAGRFSVRRALAIARSVADALAALHRNQIIHKDIKPHNIVINEQNDSVQIIDFGISVRLYQEVNTTSFLSELEGTLAYISPEQTGRMNRVVDHRSDLYSLGATLYELLTGTPPFKTTDAIGLVHSHIARVPTAPREIDRNIPVVVSDIVMKLLAKNAEDRYQHAEGLRADLDNCLALLGKGTEIHPFPLAQHDLGEPLRVSQKLYGRENDVAALEDAFTRATQEGAELVLVAGAAGVGKSVLVNELQKTVAQYRGAFSSGKFDQLNRTMPFAAVARAFGDLAHELLAEPPASVARWRHELGVALLGNGQVLVDLIPELEQLLGPQPAVPPLPPAESQNRFAVAFQSLLHVVASADHPLVLFLDDLQWADSASLRLLELLLVDPEPARVLIVGAFRDESVGTDHLLSMMLASLKKSNARVSTVEPKPLGSEHVAQLVADALRTSVESVRLLAQFVFEKTLGNPFFVKHLLSTLERQGYISFDRKIARWRWDLERIQQSGLADDIVDFLVEKLRRLSETTREVLSLAACIGHRFELRTLSALCGRGAERVAADLWEAIREGFIQPLDAAYRLVHTTSLEDARGPLANPSFNVAYCFQHDRCRQAAYSLLPEEERPRIHLRIGRRIKGSAKELRDEALFDVANHMNIGASLLAETEAEEQLEVARINLVAGRRAKASTAYEVGAAYAQAGIALLGRGAWELNHSLTFDLHIEHAECQALARHVEVAQRAFTELSARAQSRFENARIQSLRMALAWSLYDIDGALRAGTEALALFGVELPADQAGRKAMLGAELGLVAANLAGREFAALAAAPQMTDADQQTIMLLLASLQAAAFSADPVLFGSIIVKQTNISLRHGIGRETRMAYMSYAYLLANIMGRVQEARDFSELAFHLDDKDPDFHKSTRINFAYATFAHLLRPISEVLEYYERALRYGFTDGDFQNLSLSTFLSIVAQLARGDELHTVRENLQRFATILQRTKDSISMESLANLRQVVLCLQGHTMSPLSLTSEDYDEPAYEAMLRATRLKPAQVNIYYTYKVLIGLLHGAPSEQTRAWARHAEEAGGSSSGGSGDITTTEFTYFYALALTAAPDALPPAEKDLLLRLRERLAIWAGHCGANFEHRLVLVDGEIARIEGRKIDAIELYEKAIFLARKAERQIDVALAHELCSRFHRSAGRDLVANAYLAEAHYGFARMGYATKARLLEEAHPYLRERRGAPDFRRTSSSKTSTVTSTQLDAAHIIEASQAISGELVLERVLERLLRTVIENAGARRAVLLLTRAGGLEVAASIRIDPDELHVGSAVPLEQAHDVPTTVVAHVEATHETVLLADATEDPRFGGDVDIVRRKPRSVLCIPLSRQRRLAGVLYVEHDGASNVFTPARVELLQLVSIQAAVSIENARLYKDLREATDRLKSANDTLEHQVAQRTEELRRAMADLFSEMDLARKLQTVLLPQDLCIEGYEAAAAMRPADVVGGDYYDVVRSGEKDWVLVGDVSGHGVTAGLIMMIVQTSVRATLAAYEQNRLPLSPAKLLALVNVAVREKVMRIGKGLYMTIAALRVDGDEVTYAGMHDDPFIYRADSGSTEMLNMEGIWLGLLDDIEGMLPERTFRLRHGDVLLLATDGILEAQSKDGALVGAPRIAEKLQELAARGVTCAELIAQLFVELDGKVVTDDVTLLALRRQKR